MKDYYAALGIERTASKEEVKKAFRKLSMEHHPDKGGDEEKFKEINEAYSILYDDEKRKTYDNPNPFNGRFGNGFDFFKGSGRPQRSDPFKPMDGSFITAEASIPLSLYLFGGKFTTSLSFHESCGSCGGKGFTESEECDLCKGVGFREQIIQRPGFVSRSTVGCSKCQGRGIIGTKGCEKCNSKGTLFEEKEFIFDIPQNVSIGSKVILKEAGRAGINGGRRGDVGFIIAGLQKGTLNKLTPNKLEQLKNLLGELE